MESLVWEEKSELIDKRISHQVAYQGCVSLSVVGNSNVCLWPGGGMVTLWIANPPMGVRFPPRPPNNSWRIAQR